VHEQKAIRWFALGLALATGVAAGVTGCGSRPAPANLDWDDAELALLFSLSPLPGLPPSEGNRFAEDERAALLGRHLFFDTRLSNDGATSCATCHKPALYFTDGQALAVGAGSLTRHTPGLIGCQWADFFFWDGRVDSMWAQALMPIEGEIEMASTRLHSAHVVFDHYRAPYEEVFGLLPPLDDLGRFPAEGRPVPGAPQHPHAAAWSGMTGEDRETVTRIYVNIGKAIEAYERLLLPEPAPFDAYVAALQAGDHAEDDLLSDAAKRGLAAFIGPAGCVNCHSGPLFSDFNFHNIGLHPVNFDEDAPIEESLADIDRGRAVGAWKVLANPFRSDGRYGDAEINEELEFLTPDFADFEGAFRTPTLRNIARTAPYGHGGQFDTLEEVVEWYRTLPLTPMIGHRDLVLGLFDRDVATKDLVAFLQSLTGPPPAQHLLVAPAPYE